MGALVLRLALVVAACLLIGTGDALAVFSGVCLTLGAFSL